MENDICQICLVTEMLTRKSVDFGSTILGHLDKHRRKISCSHSYYIAKVNELEALIKSFLHYIIAFNKSTFAKIIKTQMQICIEHPNT